MIEATWFLLSSLCGLICLCWLRNLRTHHYPPGPTGWPVVGNLFRLTLKHPWLLFTKWKDHHGKLVYLHGLGNSIIILNTMEAVNELLDRRGNIYSHRPVFTVVGELMGLDRSMPLLPYNHAWKFHRKLARIALSPDAVKKYYPVQEDIAALLTKSFLEMPETFCDQIRLAAGRIILSVTYGLPVQSADDEYITNAERTMDLITKATVPGAFLTDIFPILKYLPSWMFHRHALRGRHMIEDFVSKLFYHVKNEMAAGVAPVSFTHQLLTDTEYEADSVTRGEYEEIVKWVAGALYGAGAETTYSTVLTMMIAMCLNPLQQARAQEEIDRVIGVHRLPTLADKGSLPYVDAVIKETMRWHPALPLSIARCTAQDDTYEGYHIPKGATIVPNVWSIANEYNPKYPSEDFCPERFLDTDAPTDPASYAFGFGRRICPGKYLAENSVFILVTSILAAFNILPHTDRQGNPVPLQPHFSSGLVSYPEHFKCVIQSRSTTRQNQVQDRAREVDLRNLG